MIPRTYRFYRQCKISKALSIQLAWVPIEAATKEKIIYIEDKVADRWKIIEAFKETKSISAPFNWYGIAIRDTLIGAPPGYKTCSRCKHVLLNNKFCNRKQTKIKNLCKRCLKVYKDTHHKFTKEKRAQIKAYKNSDTFELL